MNRFDKRYLAELAPLTAAIVFVLLLFSPLWMSGIIDNGDWHVHWFRISGFAQSLSEGTLRPLWHSDANASYGAPTFLFYPPLAYYLTSVPILFGADVATAWLLTYLFIIVLATVGGFLLFRQWVSPYAAGIMALGFSLSPPVVLLLWQFHMPAHALALALFPWFLSSILYRGKSKTRKIVFVASATFLMVLSHPLVAMQAALIAVIILSGMMIDKSYSKVTNIVFGGLLGVVASSPFWLPGILFREFIYWEYLLNPAWSWESNVLFIRPERLSGAFHDYRLLFDMLSVSALVLSLVAYQFSRLVDNGCRAMPTTICIGSILIFMIMSPWGTWLVDLLDPLRFLQFSWRWLGVQWILMLILCAWSICAAHRSRRSDLLWGPFRKFLVLIGASVVFLHAMSSVAISGSFGRIELLGIRAELVTEAKAERAIQEEYWPTLEMRPRLLGDRVGADLARDPMPSVWVKHGDLQLISIDRGQHWIELEYQAGSPGRVRLRHFNFPGWAAQLYQNGENTEIAVESEPGSGAMLIDLPLGKGVVRLEFSLARKRHRSDT